MIFNDNTTYQTYRALISIFGTLGMFLSTTPLQNKPKRNLLILGGYAVYLVVLTCLCLRFLGYLPFMRIGLLTISVPGIVISYILADTSFFRHAFNCLSQLLFSLYLIVSVTLLGSLFGGTLLSSAILLSVAYPAMVFLEFFFLRDIFLNIAGTITKGWGILSLIPCSLCVFALVLESYPEHFTNNPSFIPLFYLLGGVILIIYYAIFQYLWTQYQYQMEEQNREIFKLQVQGIKKQAEDAKRKAEDAKKVWKDTRQMLSGIAMLAKEGNAEAILKTVAEASAQNNTACPVHYCSDPILNATLNNYLGRAENSGIALKLRLAIPDTLPIDSAELSICFANALENAIKACEKLPRNERQIVIQCIHKPAFMFEIKNPYRGSVTFGKNGLPNSPGTGHGIGTRSIMAFCDKYHAFYHFSAEGGWFNLVITL